jgi:hypothetical protein
MQNFDSRYFLTNQNNIFYVLPSRLGTFPTVFHAYGNAYTHDPEKPGEKPVGNGETIPSGVLEDLISARFVAIEDERNHTKAVTKF